MPFGLDLTSRTSRVYDYASEVRHSSSRMLGGFSFHVKPKKTRTQRRLTLTRPNGTRLLYILMVEISAYSHSGKHVLLAYTPVH